MMMEDSKTFFAFANPHGQVKEVLQKLPAVWACNLKPSLRPKIFKEFWFKRAPNYSLLGVLTHLGLPLSRTYSLLSWLTSEVKLLPHLLYHDTDHCRLPGTF
jgi:hypothetical protein